MIDGKNIGFTSGALAPYRRLASCYQVYGPPKASAPKSRPKDKNAVLSTLAVFQGGYPPALESHRYAMVSYFFLSMNCSVNLAYK